MKVKLGFRRHDGDTMPVEFEILPKDYPAGTVLDVHKGTISTDFDRDQAVAIARAILDHYGEGHVAKRKE